MRQYEVLQQVQAMVIVLCARTTPGFPSGALPYLTGLFIWYNHDPIAWRPLRINGIAATSIIPSVPEVVVRFQPVISASPLFLHSTTSSDQVELTVFIELQHISSTNPSAGISGEKTRTPSLSVKDEHQKK